MGCAVGLPALEFVPLPGPALSVDYFGAGDAELRLGVCLQLLDGAPQKVGPGAVVALGNPDVFAPGQPDALLPLHERASAVAPVQHDVAHGRMIAVLQQKAPAAVRRTVIEQDDFVVGERLRQNGVDARLQKAQVVVVGNDYRYRGCGGLLLADVEAASGFGAPGRRRPRCRRGFAALGLAVVFVVCGGAIGGFHAAMLC